MKNLNFENVKGKIVNMINSDEIENPPQKLSDLGNNWELRLHCPSCKKISYVDQNTVNTIVKCICGQQLYVGIPKELF